MFFFFFFFMLCLLTFNELPSHMPPLRVRLQPRSMPWSGIEPRIPEFAGLSSIH